MAYNKPPNTADLKVRVPDLLKKSLDDIALREANTTNAVVRRFLSDGIRRTNEKEKIRK